MGRMIQLTEFWSAGEAATAVSALQAAGIPAICPDHHTSHYLPYLGMGATACRVLAPASSVDDAKTILNVMPDQGPRLHACPECGGAGLQKRNWWITLPYMLWMLATGAYGYGHQFWLRRDRKCMECRHEWTPEPALPMTEAEIGYAPDTPQLGDLAQRYFERFMALRKL